MLYAIYAPQEINFPEVDVITLFREFWHRRVETDMRTGAKAPGLDQTDLSGAAMRIAIAMLVAGAPELPKDRLTRELQATGLDASGIERLQGRGVVRVSQLGPDHLVGFFHQSFFEHAAALALIRLGGPKAIEELAQRWAKYDGNLFLGAVLERVLVLSEYELPPVDQAAERVMAALDGPSGKAVGAYVFIHRRSVPESLAEDIRLRVAEGDPLTIERLLAIGANAVRARRLALIETLGSILRTDNSRWVRRALELLLRFASPDVAQVRRVVRDADLGRLILKGANKHMQSRELYLRFLALSAADDPEWSRAQLGQFLSDAIKRQSERSCLDVLDTAVSVIGFAPRLVRELEELAGLERRNIASRITSEDVARKMGDLYRPCWQGEGISIENAIDETATKSGLAMLGRLHALGDMILEGTPAEAARAFELTGRLEDGTVRVMAARITWTRCLPTMVEHWPPVDAAAVTHHAKALAGNVLGGKRNGHADILYHVVRHGDFTKDLVRYLLDARALADADPWLDTRVLGHRLIQGVSVGIEGAQRAFAMLTRSPSEHELLARGALAQLKASPVVKRVGRELGVRYVLEGSVRRSASRVRITGQLIDTATGAHLWADRFDGGLEDIFDLQDEEVTSSVVSAMAPKLEQAEIERSKRKPTESLDSYDYFLRGMASVYQWTSDDISKALKLFYQAMELDPNFATAHGMAAWCYLWRHANGWTTNRTQEITETTRLAKRVAESGKDDAVALASGGLALAWVAGDLEGGAALIGRALTLNPNLTAAWYASGWLKAYLGETDLAIEHVARAMRLSPLDPRCFSCRPLPASRISWLATMRRQRGGRQKRLENSQIFPARYEIWRPAAHYAGTWPKRGMPLPVRVTSILNYAFPTSGIGLDRFDPKISQGTQRACDWRGCPSER
jgi:tetratricopeptide (TPR) repeat protein